MPADHGRGGAIQGRRNRAPDLDGISSWCDCISLSRLIFWFRWLELVAANRFILLVHVFPWWTQFAGLVDHAAAATDLHNDLRRRPTLAFGRLHGRHEVGPEPIAKQRPAIKPLELGAAQCLR